MKKKQLLSFLLLFLTFQLVFAQTDYQWKTATSGGYTYKYVTNDPSKSRFYTLKNGLTVILSPNNSKPEVEYRMTVRAGSNTDPRNATGLAHYLEHLLFKGTDKFGTLDYAKEKPLLDKIDALYEQYNKTTDPEKRKEIYKEIDKVSFEASNYSIANEYDKMMTAMGGNSTNAGTGTELTVYMEDFPSNSIDKFLALQSERFRNPVFRIFHTELEAVYEEKNRSLDNDNGKLGEKVRSLLFPTHNYGQQTTIGTIEHLKNPSLVEIRNYYNKYYVPNNMAAIFAGDFNPDEMIKKVDAAFSYMKPDPKLQTYNPAPEKPLVGIQRVEVKGPSAESMIIAYRGYADLSKENHILDLIAAILYNGKAGLIDININKQQKALGASASYSAQKDYGIFSLNARPKQGQTLQDVEKLLLDEIAKLKKGEFDEQLLRATIANKKLSFIQAFDFNSSRADYLMESFVSNKGEKWDAALNEINTQSKITKAEIVAFANKFFADNYIVGYKVKGVDEESVKVEKPEITPINPNADHSSAFTLKNIEAPVAPIQPKFLDFNKDISKGKARNAQVLAIKNQDNNIYRMNYRFEFGTYNYKLLSLASRYLPFLGTDKYSSEELSKKFYNIASNYNLSVGTENTSISISGLQENFEEAVSLVEHIFQNLQPNETALQSLKNNLLKERENAKLNKSSIMSGLRSYAIYGAKNPFNYTLSDEEIKAVKSEDLIKLLKNLFNYEHTITYFGPKEVNVISQDIAKLHFTPTEFTPFEPAIQFTHQPTTENKVYFANYDMVQSEIYWSRNSSRYDPNKKAEIDLFNAYFGAGMGSVVFQVIRESKALAYSTQAVYASPAKANEPYTMIAYVGSQADKMNEAIAGMNELLTELPNNEKSFIGAKSNVIKNFESARIEKDAIFSAYFAEKKLGSNLDSRKATYERAKTLNFSDINNFYKENIAGKPYAYSIIGSENRIKKEDLEKIGPLTVLSLKEIFGY